MAVVRLKIQDANPGTVFFRCRISMPCLCSPCQMRIADGVYAANRTAAIALMESQSRKLWKYAKKRLDMGDAPLRQIFVHV